MTEPEPRRPTDVHAATDVRALRALAHPLRMRLLGVLRIEGPGTSTTLARRLGESTGATSYHLRQLAAHGFVEQDLSRGAGRERWWRASQQRTEWSMADFLDAPDQRLVAGAARREALRLYGEWVQRYLQEELAWEREWVDAALFTDTWIRVTPAGLRALRQDLTQLIDRHDLGETEVPEAERVVVLLSLFPTRDGV